MAFEFRFYSGKKNFSINIYEFILWNWFQCMWHFNVWCCFVLGSLSLSSMCWLPVDFWNGNNLMVKSICILATLKPKTKQTNEFNEILWKEYKFYVNVTVSIVYTELSYRSLCVISKVRLFFGFFAVVFFQFLFCTFPILISSIKITSLALGYYMFCFGDSFFSLSFRTNKHRACSQSVSSIQRVIYYISYSHKIN